MSENMRFSSLTSQFVQKHLEAETLFKERLKECDDRIRKQEATIQELKLELEKKEKSYEQLRSDCEYNYLLVKERDHELASVENEALKLNEVNSKYKQELETLNKEKLALETEKKKESARNNEIEVYYQEKMQELRNDQELIKKELEEKNRMITKEFEVTVRDQQRQYESKYELLEKQRITLENDFKISLNEKDDQIRKLLQQIREKELIANKYISENDSIKRSYSSKLKLLEEEKQSLEQTINELFINHKNQLEELQKESSKQQQHLVASYEPTLQKLKQDIEESQNVIKKQKENIKLYQRQSDDNEKQRLFDINSLRNEYEEKLRKKETDNEMLKEKEWELTQKLENKDNIIASLKSNCEDVRKEIEKLQEDLKQSLERENNSKREVLRLNLQIDHEKEAKVKEISDKQDQILQIFRKELDEANVVIEDKERQIDELRKEVMMLNTELSIANTLKSTPYNKLKPQQKSNPKYQQMLSQVEDELGLGSIDSVSSPSSIGLSIKDDYKNSIEHQNNSENYMSSPIDKLKLSSIHIDQITKMNSLMTELRLDLESQKEKVFRAEEKLIDMATENKILRSKLKEAVKDLKRVYKEKEQLTDISNMLKSELTKTKEALFFAKESSTVVHIEKPISPKPPNDSLGISGKSKTISQRKKKLGY